MRYVIGLGVVVMLAVGLMAANPEGTGGGCCYPNGLCSQDPEDVCLSSNGVWYEDTPCLSVACVPHVPPTVVGGSGIPGVNGKWILVRTWSDGTVDQLIFDKGGSACIELLTHCSGPTVIFGPPACPEDIDNNSDVGVTDLLQLLGKWGPCQ